MNITMRSQFILIAIWFASTLISGVLYRMVINAIYFEFPTFILLIQSVIGLLAFQIISLLDLEFCKTWRITLDLKAIYASLALSFSISTNFSAFYFETPLSNALQYLLAPLLTVFAARTTKIRTSKHRGKLRIFLSFLSWIFTYFSIKTEPTTNDGLIFGSLALLSNISCLLLLRNYLKTNCYSQFLFSHFIFTSVLLFIYELFQHNIHQIFLYVKIWQMPYFYPVILSFVATSTISLIALCHVIRSFDLSTISMSLNTMSGWQFVLVQYIYEHVAMKDYYDIHSDSIIFAMSSFIVTLFMFFIDAKTRISSQLF